MDSVWPLGAQYYTQTRVCAHDGGDGHVLLYPRLVEPNNVLEGEAAHASGKALDMCATPDDQPSCCCEPLRSMLNGGRAA